MKTNFVMNIVDSANRDNFEFKVSIVPSRAVLFINNIKRFVAAIVLRNSIRN